MNEEVLGLFLRVSIMANLRKLVHPKISTLQVHAGLNSFDDYQ